MGSCLSSDGWAGRPMPQTAFQREARPRRSRSIRRRFSTNSACTAKSDDLGKIPGRMLANGASQIASMFTQQGRKGTNQDAMIVWEEFGSRKDIVLCGVFDGHGPFGHLVARKVRDALPSKLWAQWQSVAKDDDNSRDLNGRSGSIHSEDSVLSSTDGEWKEALDREEGDNRPEIFHTLKESFMKAFKIMDKELKFHPSIDCFCSGSTAVTLVKKGQDLVIGNIGDSRAILGTRTEDNTLTAVQLTVDFKPNLPNEAERIRKCRGRVFALHDEPDVARVWLPNNDSPGLAMARAFGDFCLKDFGLISVPDVSYRRLTEKDEFIVLATDGVWDVLSNNEVIDIVASARSRSSAAKALVECAVRSWKLKYPTSRIDDCAVVCLFLDNPSSSEQHLNFGTSQGSSAPQLSRAISVTAASLHEGEQSGSRSSVDSDTFALDRANSVRDLRTQSQRKLSEFLATDEEEEWSALEGVTRVNSLLNIPRFRGAPNVGGEKKHV